MLHLKLQRPTHIANWDVCPRLMRYRKEGWTPVVMPPTGLRPLAGIAVASAMEHWHMHHDLEAAKHVAFQVFASERRHREVHGVTVPDVMNMASLLPKIVVNAASCELFQKWTDIRVEVPVEGVEGARVDVLGRDEYGVWSVADYKVTFPTRPMSDWDVDLRFSSYLYGHQSGLYTASQFTVGDEVIAPQRFYIVLVENDACIYYRYREISHRDRQAWMRQIAPKLRRMQEDDDAPIDNVPYNEHHKDAFGRQCEFFEGCVMRNGVTSTWGDVYTKVPSNESTRPQVSNL